MTIILAGGSGFLGQALTAHLAGAGHSVHVLTRSPRPGTTDIGWQADGTSGPWASALASADAIINLAGQGIADKRWTAARKEALRTSRLLPARSLARALADAPPRPRRLIAASAIGYYGPRGDQVVTEQTPPGSDFLSDLCVEWEAESAHAASDTTHVALVRTGIVLHPDGGALASMLPPFRMGVGGPMGSGRQFMSWIHLDDWVALVAWLATSTPRVEGAGGDHLSAWNATAPEPVTNKEFARTLGRVLGRPALIPAPAFALRILLGEFANFLVTGARVLPDHAERAGFRFAHRSLEPALRHLLGPR